MRLSGLYHRRPLAGIDLGQQGLIAFVLVVVAAGALVAVAPLAAAASVGLGALAVLTAKRHAAIGIFMSALFVLLVGYAFMGRGFAYLGAPPMFIGEMVMGLGLITVLIAPSQRPFTTTHVVIAMFMAWGALRTLPYIATPEIDALRDAVSWGYAVFAFIVYRLVRLVDIERLISGYARVLPVIVVWTPILAAAWFTSRGLFPMVPGTNVEIPYFKAGDLAVHLAGASAFVLVGLYPGTRGRRLTEPLLWAAWILGFASVAALNRGGMVAVMVATSTVLFFVRSFARWYVVILTGLLLITVVATANLEVDVGRNRSLSFGQVIENFQSVVGEANDPNLAGTRAWREDWWSKIVSYTFGGDYFWDGKGYGINLAVDDGFAGTAFPNLRAPHNAHLQFLARSGVPGFALWVGVQVAFASTMLLSAQRSARARHRRWVAVHAWILAFWAAAIVNMTFDVYLEGPQGGILFWCLIGLGLGVAALARKADRDLGAPPPITAPPSLRPVADPELRR